MENSFLVNLIICFMLSFFIGIERQYRRRSVGLRTTILVSVGSYLFVSFSFLIGATDISRIASQVVTGIGFLGAGVILKDGTKIQGLTTAATLWCDAAIGVLCAGGAVKEAIYGTLIILFANIVLRYINSLINMLSKSKNSKQSYCLELKVLKEDYKEIQNKIKEELNKKYVSYDYKVKREENCNVINYRLTILGKYHNDLEKFIDNLEMKYKIDFLSINKLDTIIEIDEEL